MADDSDTFEEEEFTTEFNGQTVLRILAQARPHWPLAGRLPVCITVRGAGRWIPTSPILSKRIIDEGIVARDTEALFARSL